jgi:hypothetical protein
MSGMFVPPRRRVNGRSPFFVFRSPISVYTSPGGARMRTAWEYASVEWIWNANKLRCTRAGSPDQLAEGSYGELIQLLNWLGHEGWEICSCAGAGNWLFWTLKRPVG